VRVRVRGRGQTFVFQADSSDGRLVIRQEPEGGEASDVCSLTLKDPEELRAFFTGLRRIVGPLGYGAEAGAAAAVPAPAPPSAGMRSAPRPALGGRTPGRDEEREALISQARQRNPQAFAPWTPEEEQEVRRRYQAGAPIDSPPAARRAL